MGIFGKGRKPARRNLAEKVARRRAAHRFIRFLLIYGALAGFLFFGVLKTYQFFTKHRKFTIAQFEIQGASTKVEAELRAQMEWIQGENLFTADLSQVRALALKHSWVEDVAVRTELPNKLLLHVREKVPAGLVLLDGAVFVVEDGGSLICPLNDYDQALNFPIIQGLAADGQQAVEIRRALHILATIKQTSLFFWDNMETLDLSDRSNLVVRLAAVDAPLYLGKAPDRQNILNYLSIADYIQREYPKLKYIELGFPRQIAVMPVHGSKND